MPEMDGFVATSRIRNLAYGKKVPIIAVTAHALDEDRQLCLASGMNDHIPKPIDKMQLFDAMMKLIPHKKRLSVEVISPQSQSASNNILPEFLTGIDLSAGVMRLDGNQALYHSLLIDFAQEFVHVVDDVKSRLFDVAKEDVQTARRLVHSVKGMAGNLAAMELHKDAANLEKAILESRQDEWFDLFVIFNKAVNLVLRSIATLDNSPGEQESNIVPYDIVQIEQLLNDLADSIRNKRFKARKQLASIKKRLRSDDCSETMQLLEACLEKYDFAGAENHLQELSNILDITIVTAHG